MRCRARRPPNSAKKASGSTRIIPGGIVTGIFAKNAGIEGSKADQVTDLLKVSFATLQPIPRAGLPEDIARAAVFLASDASSFVNGQEIVVDGGMGSVTRGWTVSATGRAEMNRRLRKRRRRCRTSRCLFRHCRA